MLRKHGVVGKFVEYFGPGLQELATRRPRHNRQYVPGIRRDLRHLSRGQRKSYLPAPYRPLARSRSHWSRPTAASRGCSTTRRLRKPNTPNCLRLILTTVESSLAGPKRPQDRVTLSQAGESFRIALPSLMKPKSAAKATAPPVVASGSAPSGSVSKQVDRWEQEGGSPSAVGVAGPHARRARHCEREKSLRHGSVVIAAITSCTNTSNPSVMVAAGLVAKKAVEKGSDRPALGKDFTRARLESCPRLSGESRTAAVSRKDQVPHRRLRLHHLYRKLRTAAEGSFAKPSTRRIWW